MLNRTKRTIALVLVMMLTLPIFVQAEGDMALPDTGIDIEDPGILAEGGDVQEELILDDIELSLEPPADGTGSELLETTLPTDIDGETQIQDPGAPGQEGTEATEEAGEIASNARERLVPYIDPDTPRLIKRTYAQPVQREMTEGWYVVNQNTTYNERMVIDGNVSLILANGKILNAKEGIYVKEGSTLFIWAQSSSMRMGKLIARGSGGNAGIGGNEKTNSGAIVINGGNIEATGGSGDGKGGAGIGAGSEGNNQQIYISGGQVKANGGADSAGIGGAMKCKYQHVNITIEGGTVIATGYSGGAGIGGGRYQQVNGIIIKGGNVTAKGSVGSAGIGGGAYGICFDITLSGGTIKATGGEGAAGIGSGCIAHLQGDIVISGNKTRITAEGGHSGAGIGTGEVSTCSSGGVVDIRGGKVTAIGGYYGAGIGGGRANANGEGGDGATVKISGKPTVIAQADGGSAVAIGNGDGSKLKGKLTIDDGLMVVAGNGDKKDERLFPYKKRTDVCQESLNCSIKPCSHQDATYGNITETTHTRNRCKYCNTSFEPEAHDFDPTTQKCKACGYIKGQRYMITFDANGGKGEMNRQKLIEGKTGRLKANAFTWSGHTFKGWNTKADGSGKSYADKARVTLKGDITLYAQWYINVTLVSDSLTVEWDGELHAVRTYTVKAGKQAVKAQFPDIRVIAEGRSVGTYPVEFRGVKLNETKDSTGTYLATKVVEGKLTIEKKKPKVVPGRTAHGAAITGLQRQMAEAGQAGQDRQRRAEVQPGQEGLERQCAQGQGCGRVDRLL